MAYAKDFSFLQDSHRYFALLSGNRVYTGNNPLIRFCAVAVLKISVN